MKKQEPIRILQCVSNMDRAGIETMLMNFYRNVDKDKIQFDLQFPGSYTGARALFFDFKAIQRVADVGGRYPLVFF